MPNNPVPGQNDAKVGDVRVVLDDAKVVVLIGLAAEKAVQRRAAKIERAAKRYCPVDTGRLRSSITSETGEDGEGPFAIVGTDVEYAVHVEFGTNKMSAQSFLRRAVDEETR